MTQKATFQFLIGRSSPTETHYRTSVGSILTVEVSAVSLAEKRAKLLGPGAVLTEIRISDSATPRDVRTLISPDDFTGTSPLTADAPNALGQNDTDQANASLMCHVRTLGKPKNLYLAGIPDSVMVVDPNFPA